MCCRSRTRAGRLRSPARRPARTSPTFCWAFRAPARSRSAIADKYLRAIRVRCLRQRRLAIQSRAHGECRRPVGVRGADDRAVRTAGEPGCRAGVCRGQPGRRRAIRSASLTGTAVSRFADAVRIWRGIQPRVGVAWRPVPGSSLVVRAGYGVYRNTNVYQSIALLLAQQPPLSKTFSVQNSAANPLTLANGFVASAGRHAEYLRGRSRFPRRLRGELAGVGATRPAGSLTVLATYLGTQGQPLDAGVPAEHLSRRRQSIRVPRVPPDSSISPRTAARRDMRVSSSCGVAFATA